MRSVSSGDANGLFGAIRHAERILFFAESLQFQGNTESSISKVKTMMRSALRAGARAPGGGLRATSKQSLQSGRISRKRCEKPAMWRHIRGSHGLSAGARRDGRAKVLSMIGSKERGAALKPALPPAIRLADGQMVPQRIELFNGVRPDVPKRDVLAAKGSAKPDAAAIQCRCCSGNGLAQTHFPPAHLSNSGDCCGLNHTCQTAPSEQLTSHSSVPSSPA